METQKKNFRKINKTKSCFIFEKNQQNSQLVRLIKKEREKNQIDAIKKDKGISPLIPQKYKLPSEITTNNSMHLNQ